ncbi:MAG: hypothetical protein M3T56_09605 [Chloroflexota bacterium]|nr:hypothetical protein [Chloroflexota bacterium]
MSVINLKKRYQISPIAQFGKQEVEMLRDDGNGIGPKDLGDAGWRVVSTFIGPGKTQHGVGQFLWALWELTED